MALLVLTLLSVDFFATGLSQSTTISPRRFATSNLNKNTSYFDAYNNSVLLDDDQVAFYWTLSGNSISIAAESKKRSGYLAIAFGTSMVNSYAYVGWIDENDKARISTYWIDSHGPSGLHPVYDKDLIDTTVCRSDNGLVSFEFSSQLSYLRGQNIEADYDLEAPLPVVWARGEHWSEDDSLSLKNKHIVTSGRAVRILLMEGSLEVAEGVPVKLLLHGILMFVSWGILFPAGILAARYLQFTFHDNWFQIHVCLQYLGCVVGLLGVILAVTELRGIVFSSAHARFGLLVIAVTFLQPINGHFRPKTSSNNDSISTKRIVWQYLHCIAGRCSVLIGIVAVLSGLKYVADAYDYEAVDAATWAFMIWVMISVVVVLYLEYSEIKRTRNQINYFGISLSSRVEEEEVDSMLQ